jgi:LysM repeat protein
MQIGNPGDPALSVLKEGKEGSLLIMESALHQALKAGRVDDPEINIKAGIAYLFARLAKFANKSVPDPRDSKVYEHKVAKGDSLWSIAQTKGTTLDELNSRNPGISAHIRPGQVLKYCKAKMDLTIAGWRSFSVQEIAQRWSARIGA